MDPVSQGVLGAAFAQLKAAKQHGWSAVMVGCLAGMAPDLDIFIRSKSDPMLALEYHRHFTHALVFIPFGALICAAGFFGIGVLRRRFNGPPTVGSPHSILLNFRLLYLWCILGYATHALLDACTSYGTQLFWPFTDYRAAWDIISVIDPLFTLPGIALVLTSVVLGKRAVLFAALFWWGGYLSLGVLQQYRAKVQGYELANSRGHQPTQVWAKPSFGNVAVWKTLYLWQGYFYVDAVKPGVTNSKVWSGERIARLSIQRDLPWLDQNSQQARDLERFKWFSAGFVALIPGTSNAVGDIRYSLVPNTISPLWYIELDPNADHDQHVRYTTNHSNRGHASQRLWEMIWQ